MTARSVVRFIYERWFRPHSLSWMQRRGLVVGRDFHMLNGVSLDWSHCWHISIGSEVTLAPMVQVLAHDASTKRLLGHTRIGKVDIGDRVFVGASTVILPGVSIGSDVVIGAGSVVSHDIPSGTVAAGNPARVICSMEDWLQRKRLEMEAVPVFGREYTLSGGVTGEMRADMNRRMNDGVGYIV